MNERPIIFGGLGLLLIAGTSPFWLSAASGGSGTPPDFTETLERARANGTCVESTEYMRDAHMDLLNGWRDQVVRSGVRTGE